LESGASLVDETVKVTPPEGATSVLDRASPDSDPVRTTDTSTTRSILEVI
jgi:hypothetical protein